MRFPYNPVPGCVPGGIAKHRGRQQKMESEVIIPSLVSVTAGIGKQPVPPAKCG
ncbi:MAG: hypothetical protein V3T68_03935 [Dehalococcoidales bacterium]